VDNEALRQRLLKEIGVLEKLVLSNDRQLSNEEFVNRAPAKIVESMRAKLAEYIAQIKKNRDTLDQLR
jgi:valyl-tRNA synthetase